MPDLANIVRQTGGARLVEAAPHDKAWGAGKSTEDITRDPGAYEAPNSPESH